MQNCKHKSVIHKGRTSPRTQNLHQCIFAIFFFIFMVYIFISMASSLYGWPWGWWRFKYQNDWEWFPACTLWDFNASVHVLPKQPTHRSQSSRTELKSIQLLNSCPRCRKQPETLKPQNVGHFYCLQHDKYNKLSTHGFLPRLNTTRKRGQKRNSSPLFMRDDLGEERRMAREKEQY